MNSFVELVTVLKMIFFRYFLGFCLKVLEGVFDRIHPCIFVVIIVNRLCTVFLRESRITLTIRSIIKSF